MNETKFQKDHGGTTYNEINMHVMRRYEYIYTFLYMYVRNMHTHIHHYNDNISIYIRSGS